MTTNTFFVRNLTLCSETRVTVSKFEIFILIVGNIRALIVNSNNPSDKTYIFSQTNNQGSGWQMGSASIGALPAGYKVRQSSNQSQLLGMYS